MKKIMAIILAIVMVLGVTGCTGDVDNPPIDNNRPPTNDNQPQPPIDNDPAPPPPPVGIPENPASDFNYRTVDGGVEITGYIGNTLEVKIPNIIEGAHVVSISGAFDNRSAITEIIIPDSVTNIGSRAFQGTALTSIVLPNGIASIGDEVFANTGLTSVILPNNLERIGSEVFANTGISNITLPDTVTRVGNDGFRCCINWIDGSLIPEMSYEEQIEQSRSIHDERCGGLTLESVTFKGITYYVERRGSVWDLPQEFYDIINGIECWYCGWLSHSTKAIETGSGVFFACDDCELYIDW
jgi:predicted small lipoprotein YifL